MQRNCSRIILGDPRLDDALPGAGLDRGALHEVHGAVYRDGPAASGFILALAARARSVSGGAVVWIASMHGPHDFGAVYGRALHRFGHDPRGFIFIRARHDQETLWAMEECLRARGLAAVCGSLNGALTLTASRRLHLAAQKSGTPALLLRTHNGAGASAAATRWRVMSGPTASSVSGVHRLRRWHLVLERCRNGNCSEWLVEWDHAAHCFRVVQEMAVREVHPRAEAESNPLARAV